MVRYVKSSELTPPKIDSKLAPYDNKHRAQAHAAILAATSNEHRVHYQSIQNCSR